MLIITKYAKHFLILFAVIFIYNCNSSDVPNNNIVQPIYKDLDSIKTNKKLRALINYSSTSYFLYKGNPMGFEYELLKKYADYIDVELEIIPIKNMDSVFTDLNNGKGDIVAANLTITKERLQQTAFTSPILITQQVLIQRKPENWKSLSKKKLNEKLITSSIDLTDKTVVVREGSAFNSRLKNLSNEIGGTINIKTVPGEITMEQLIEQVANGDINYTIADKNIARVNQWHYPNIDANLTISSDQQIAWAIRSNSDSLTTSINNWLKEYQKTKKFKMLVVKYFKNQKNFKKRVNNDYYTLTSGEISPYDDLIKKYAPKINWDWELLASLIYQESHFNNKAIGWGGAFGLMQFMPTTGARFGVNESSSPEENIKAGVKYIKYLEKMWINSVPDSLERIKFVLASYNVGPGHVQDAQKLARKYSDNPALWKDVGYYLLHKSEPAYYKDAIVKHGYCKGYITYEYVNEIFERHEHYKNIVSESNLAKK